jgi:F0F1-type ATP synthase epsilon subunit
MPMSKDIIKPSKKGGVTVITEEAQRAEAIDQRAKTTKAEQDQSSAQKDIARTLSRVEAGADRAKKWAWVSIVAAVISAIAAVIQLFK